LLANVKTPKLGFGCPDFRSDHSGGQSLSGRDEVLLVALAAALANSSAVLRIMPASHGTP
jgi:hypothetical protein